MKSSNNINQIFYSEKIKMRFIGIILLLFTIYVESRSIYILYCPNQIERFELVKWAFESFVDEVKDESMRVYSRPLYNYVLADIPWDSTALVVYVGSRGTGGLPPCLTHLHPQFHTEKMNRKNVISVTEASEVFNGKYNCGSHTLIGKDFVLDRSKSRVVNGDCIKIHYYQGLGFQSRDQKGYNLKKLCEKLPIEPNTRETSIILISTRAIKFSLHRNDALFRVLVYKTLMERGYNVRGTAFVKEIGATETWVRCRGNDLDTIECKRSFTHSIDMENSQESGYVTEKIFTGLLADTVPIYFGDPFVSELVNPERIVQCHVPTDTIQQIRSINKTYTSEGKRDLQRLMDAVFNKIKPEIYDCIDKINESLNRIDEIINKPVFTRAICNQNPINFNVGKQLKNHLMFHI